jgi:hypothetical protein
LPIISPSCRCGATCRRRRTASPRSTACGKRANSTASTALPPPREGLAEAVERRSVAGALGAGQELGPEHDVEHGLAVLPLRRDMPEAEDGLAALDRLWQAGELDRFRALPIIRSRASAAA